jgi:hypothetical protein
MTSADAKPKVLSAVVFHQVILPCVSTPIRIDGIAVSNWAVC